MKKKNPYLKLMSLAVAVLFLMTEVGYPLSVQMDNLGSKTASRAVTDPLAHSVAISDLGDTVSPSWLAHQRINNAIQPIIEALGEYFLLPKKDGFYDFRYFLRASGALEDAYLVYRGNIEINGEEYAFTIRLHRDTDILNFISEAFPENHVGFTERSTYARNEAKTAHEEAEFETWINFFEEEYLRRERFVRNPSILHHEDRVRSGEFRRWVQTLEQGASPWQKRRLQVYYLEGHLAGLEAERKYHLARGEKSSAKALLGRIKKVGSQLRFVLNVFESFSTYRMPIAFIDDRANLQSEVSGAYHRVIGRGKYYPKRGTDPIDWVEQSEIGFNVINLLEEETGNELLGPIVNGIVTGFRRLYSSFPQLEASNRWRLEGEFIFSNGDTWQARVSRLQNKAKRWDKKRKNSHAKVSKLLIETIQEIQEPSPENTSLLQDLGIKSGQIVRRILGAGIREGLNTFWLPRIVSKAQKEIGLSDDEVISFEIVFGLDVPFRWDDVSGLLQIDYKYLNTVIENHDLKYSDYSIRLTAGAIGSLRRARAVAPEPSDSLVEREEVVIQAVHGIYDLHEKIYQETKPGYRAYKKEERDKIYDWLSREPYGYYWVQLFRSLDETKDINERIRVILRFLEVFNFFPGYEEYFIVFGKDPKPIRDRIQVSSGLVGEIVDEAKPSDSSGSAGEFTVSPGIDIPPKELAGFSASGGKGTGETTGTKWRPGRFGDNPRFGFGSEKSSFESMMPSLTSLMYLLLFIPILLFAYLFDQQRRAALNSDEPVGFEEVIEDTQTRIERPDEGEGPRSTRETPDEWQTESAPQARNNSGRGGTGPYELPFNAGEGIIAQVEGEFFGPLFTEFFPEIRPNQDFVDPGFRLTPPDDSLKTGTSSTFRYRINGVGETQLSPLLYLQGFIDAESIRVRPLDGSSEVPGRLVNGRFITFNHDGPVEIEFDIENYSRHVGFEYEATPLPENELQDFPNVFSFDLIRYIQAQLSPEGQERLDSLLEGAVGYRERLDRIAAADRTLVTDSIKVQAIANVMNKYAVYNGSDYIMNANGRSWGSTWDAILRSDERIRLISNTVSRMFVLMSQRLGMKAGYVRQPPVTHKEGFLTNAGIPHGISIIEINGEYRFFEGTTSIGLEAGLLVISRGGTSLQGETEPITERDVVIIRPTNQDEADIARLIEAEQQAADSIAREDAARAAEEETAQDSASQEDAPSPDAASPDSIPEPDLFFTDFTIPLTVPDLSSFQDATGEAYHTSLSLLAFIYYGDIFGYERIYLANRNRLSDLPRNNRDMHYLEPNSELLIPDATTVEHYVIEGETVSDLVAYYYGSVNYFRRDWNPVKRIALLNGLDPENPKIQEGQILQIPISRAEYVELARRDIERSNNVIGALQFSGPNEQGDVTAYTLSFNESTGQFITGQLFFQSS